MRTEEIELRALQAVEAHERRLGRIPQRMEANNNRLVSTSPRSRASPRARSISIEVKGRIAGATTFFVTNQEVRYGQNTGDQYRLALVEVSP